MEATNLNKLANVAHRELRFVISDCNDAAKKEAQRDFRLSDKYSGAAKYAHNAQEFIGDLMCAQAKEELFVELDDPYRGWRFNYILSELNADPYDARFDGWVKPEGWRVFRKGHFRLIAQATQAAFDKRDEAMALSKALELNPKALDDKELRITILTTFTDGVLEQRTAPLSNLKNEIAHLKKDAASEDFLSGDIFFCETQIYQVLDSDEIYEFNALDDPDELLEEGCASGRFKLVMMAERIEVETEDANGLF